MQKTLGKITLAKQTHNLDKFYIYQTITWIRLHFDSCNHLQLAYMLQTLIIKMFFNRLCFYNKLDNTKSWTKLAASSGDASTNIYIHEAPR